MLRPTVLIAILFSFCSIAGATNRSFFGDISFSTDCHHADINAVISFNGDILIHNDFMMRIGRNGKNYTPLWEQTNSLINKADFSVANLEGPAALGIDTEGDDHGDVGFTWVDVATDAPQEVKEALAVNAVYYGTAYKFNYHPRVLSDLQNSGYDLLTMANNHALDRFSIGIDRTLEYAKSIRLPIAGVRASSDTGGEFYQVSNVGGLNVAFISCTVDLNKRNDKKNQVLLCYKHAEKIENMISVLSKHQSIDTVIVLPHWGEEYEPEPNKDQKDYAKKFLNAGATAIIGSHPHVLQPWEKFITDDGRETLVIYSLGNFLAYQKGLQKATGAVAYLGLSKAFGKTTISGVGVTPTARINYAVTPVTSMSRDMKALINSKFGLKNLIAPTENLSKFCR